MFWKYNTMSSSQLETLLEKECVSLSEILEEDDVIQECKNQNKKLIEFLCRPANLQELIQLVVTEPPENCQESERFRLPNLAAEILTCEIEQINEQIASDEALLQQLYAFLDQPAPLNPLLASFFSKAFGVLLTRRSEQNWYNYQVSFLKVFEFLKTKSLVTDLLRHIGTSAISDLILSLVTCGEETEIKQGLIEYLNENRLIQSIIELLSPTQGRDTNDNASRLLIEFLGVSRYNQCEASNELRCEDPLLQALEDPSTVDLLLEVMLRPNPETGSTCESSLNNGIATLLVLLESRMPQPVELVQPAISAATFNASVAVAYSDIPTPEMAAKQRRILLATIDSILPKIPDFTELLVNPPPKDLMKTTAGPLEPPLGTTRLGVAKLTSALIATNHKDVHMKLIECKTVDILLDLFFKYSLNNFLHSQVEQCIKQVFSFKPISLIEEIPATPVPEEGEAKPQTASEETTEEEEAAAADPEVKPVPATEEMEAVATDDSMDTTVPLEVGPLDSSDEVVTIYENPLLSHLIAQCQLVEKVMVSLGEEAAETKGKLAYNGHLIKIANNLVEYSEKDECKDFILNVMVSLEGEVTSQWETFTKGKLAEMNERNTIVQINSYGNALNSSGDDDSDCKDMQFGQDGTLQQMFSDYQMQEMSEHFIDSFGIRNEEFNNDSEPSPLANARHITNTNFGLDDDTGDDGAKEMFDAVCNERLGKLPPMSADDIDDSEDLWENRTREINFATTIEAIPKQNVTQINSSDEENDDDDSKESDDDDDSDKKASPDKNMDVDNTWPTPDEVEDIPASVATNAAMDTGNPWDANAAASEKTSTSPVASSPVKSQEPPTPEETGWANFDSNFSAEAAKSSSPEDS